MVIFEENVHRTYPTQQSEQLQLALRCLFQKEKKKQSKSGASRTTWPWYERMDRFLGENPEMTFIQKAASIGGKHFQKCLHSPTLCEIELAGPVTENLAPLASSLEKSKPESERLEIVVMAYCTHVSV